MGFINFLGQISLFRMELESSIHASSLFELPQFIFDHNIEYALLATGQEFVFCHRSNGRRLAGLVTFTAHNFHKIKRKRSASSIQGNLNGLTFLFISLGNYTSQDHESSSRFSRRSNRLFTAFTHPRSFTHRLHGSTWRPTSFLRQEYYFITRPHALATPPDYTVRFTTMEQKSKMGFTSDQISFLRHGIR